jgi:hypothetical protein
MRTNCPDCVWVTSKIGGATVIKGYNPCDVCRKDTLHATPIKVDGGTWTWPTYSDYCHRCSKDMRARAVHPSRTDWPTNVGAFDTAEELQNEATLIFTGGYGSFIDAIDSMPSVRLCHECAHEVCEFIGIDPRLWHTHSVYGGQHADHHDNYGATP